MKSALIRMFVVTVALLGLPITPALAAFQAHVYIRGTRQGQFKGETVKVTGQASGKRQHGTVVIVKESGPATAQSFAGVPTDEVLPSVVLELYATDGDGETTLERTIALTNATLAGIKQYTSGKRQLEEVTFTFEEIEDSADADQSF